MFAYVLAGQVSKITAAESVEWGGVTISNVRLLTPTERKERGIYDFVPASPVPAYHRAGATSYVVDDVAGTVTESVVATELTIEEVLPGLKEKIKNIRAAALEKFTKNSGIATVYDLNYQAALLGDQDTTTTLRNSKTPHQHLTDFGQYVGMTGAQFAAYIIAENSGPTGAAAGVKMSEIEQEYLRLYYTVAGTATVVAELDAAVSAYQAYCDARTVA